MFGRSFASAFLACLFAAGSAAAQTSSELIRTDPAGQYLLIKGLVQPPLLAQKPLSADPQGYGIEGCWTPYYELGDFAKPAGLAGEMIIRASETAVWRRDLAALGYPAGPLEEAIGRYEKVLIGASFVVAARDEAVAAFQRDLDAIRAAAPRAAKVRRYSGCGGPGSISTLHHVTVPAGGEVRFIPEDLHSVCRVQKIDPDDPKRCDHWMTRRDEPIAFPQHTTIFYVARWPGGAVVKGTFRPERYCETVGCVATVEIRRP